jgi:hypothetical protein
MEKPTRIVSQVYGYAVCLVAVITFLISVTATVNAVIDRGDPIHSAWNPAGSPSLVSFENYKSDVLKSSAKGSDKTNEAYVPDDNTLRSMYEAARNDRIQSSLHQANKSLLIGGLIMVISVVLFFTHWKWLRKMTKAQ